MPAARRFFGLARRSFAGASNAQSSILIHKIAPGSPISPPPGAIAKINREEASDKTLFRKAVTAQLREEGKRAVALVRKREWIPTCIRGRGRIPDILIQVDPKPFTVDFKSGIFCFMKRAKYMAMGPMYELRIEEGGLDEYGNVMSIAHMPFERIRVIPHNIQIHPVRNLPNGFQLTYVPEDERVRIRVPIEFINEEKSPGINSGGWLNRFLWNIEIAVDPFVPPPPFAEVDVGALTFKQRVTIEDLMFARKGEGCDTVLPASTPVATISKF